MGIARIADAQQYSFIIGRSGELQLELARLREQIASGVKLTRPQDDPAGAARVVRFDASLAALAQHREASGFGTDVLSAEDAALKDAHDVLVRAEEIATQQASGTLSADERAAAAEEVRGLLDALTQVGNTELSGRRVFAGLALDAAAPFADPPDDLNTYNPAAAYTGSQQEFEVKTGSTATERVRITTRGDTIFQPGLQALHDLWRTLDTNGDVPATLAGLKAARETVSAERASVGARQAQLVGRADVVTGLEVTDEAARARVRDADLVATVASLAQAENALQALLAASGRFAQTSLVQLLQI